jgi:hypothetical protein
MITYYDGPCCCLGDGCYHIVDPPPSEVVVVAVDHGYRPMDTYYPTYYANHSSSSCLYCQGGGGGHFVLEVDGVGPTIGFPIQP